MNLHDPGRARGAMGIVWGACVVPSVRLGHLKNMIIS